MGLGRRWNSARRPRAKLQRPMAIEAITTKFAAGSTSEGPPLRWRRHDPRAVTAAASVRLLDSSVTELSTVLL